MEKLNKFLVAKNLSNREVEVVHEVIKGLSNKEVANGLFVTEKTVKFHMTNIMKKLKLKSRAEVIVTCQPHLPNFNAKVKFSGDAALPEGA